MELLREFIAQRIAVLINVVKQEFIVLKIGTSTPITLICYSHPDVSEIQFSYFPTEISHLAYLQNIYTFPARCTVKISRDLKHF